MRRTLQPVYEVSFLKSIYESQIFFITAFLVDLLYLRGIVVVQNSYNSFCFQVKGIL